MVAQLPGALLAYLRPTECEIKHCQSNLKLHFHAFKEEHVPDPQHCGPGQRPREDTHKPFGAVEDRIESLIDFVRTGGWKFRLWSNMGYCVSNNRAMCVY